MWSFVLINFIVTVASLCLVSANTIYTGHPTNPYTNEMEMKTNKMKRIIRITPSTFLNLNLDITNDIMNPIRNRTNNATEHTAP